MSEDLNIRPMGEVLEDEELQPQVIDDAAQLIDDEVKRKRGFSGTLLKSGYAVVRRLNRGRMIHDVLEALLPEFVESIEPIHARYRDQRTNAKSSDGFGVYLSDVEDEATEALLSVTDKRAENTRHKVIKKTYKKLRPRAEKHVKEALPALGELIDKYTLGYEPAGDGEDTSDEERASDQDSASDEES